MCHPCLSPDGSDIVKGTPRISDFRRDVCEFAPSIPSPPRFPFLCVSVPGVWKRTTGVEGVSKVL